jgi:hypothetical protein
MKRKLVLAALWLGTILATVAVTDKVVAGTYAQQMARSRCEIKITDCECKETIRDLR